MSYLCSNPWTTAFIWKNGDVTHCCYSNIGPIGNIYKNSLEEIWSGDKINAIRDKIREGRYIEAGCEQFCRPYRWNRLYSNDKGKIEIPEGLGRINEVNYKKAGSIPSIIGIELDGRCNFKCAHCLASNSLEGLPENEIAKLWHYLQSAQVVRIVGGEFTVNKRSLEKLDQISRLSVQPTVFMNTNGHIGIEEYKCYISCLKKFHLKFSLEGMGEDYEKVRKGGSWERFCQNLFKAKEYFDLKNQQGHEWKLYLNFCVMKSNFNKLPQIVKFAVDNNIRLVLNTINGMRHIDENIFMYDHLKIPQKNTEYVSKECHRIINESYVFEKELKQHLDYIIRVLEFKKIKMPYRWLKAIQTRLGGQKADRILYIYYKWVLNKKSAVLYVIRKVRKRILKV